MFLSFCQQKHIRNGPIRSITTVHLFFLFGEELQTKPIDKKYGLTSPWFLNSLKNSRVI